MIIGITGTHGTGKSTILNGLEQLGCEVNNLQLSRRAQKMLNCDSLEAVLKEEKLMWALQETILSMMYLRDEPFYYDPFKFVVVDRTPIDVWAYTVEWCKKFDIDPVTHEHGLAIKKQCDKMANWYTNFLVVPISNSVRFVPEKNRADENSRISVENSIFEFLETYKEKTYTVNSIGKQERISECASIIAKMIKNV